MKHTQDQTRNKIWSFFCLSLFLSCFFISLIKPPLQSPDEAAHIARAYLLKEKKIILETPSNSGSGGYIDLAFLHWVKYYSLNAESKIITDDIDQANTINWTEKKIFAAIPGTGFYFPLIYAPHAFGLMLGETFGLSIDTSYKITVFSALSTSILIIFFAFRIYHPPLLAAALLITPMTLFQLSSPSLDGISTAITILAISAFMRITIEKEKSKPWLLYTLITSIMLVASCRAHLLPLLTLPLTAYFYTKNKKYIVASCISSILIISWMIVAIKNTSDLRATSTLSASDIIIFYIEKPLHFIMVLFNTITTKEYYRFYLKSFIGILGWLDASFKDNIYNYFYIFLCAILASSINIKKISEQWQAKCLLLSCALSSFLLIFFALLITWNSHPATVIQGVQGRYFLAPALLISYAFNFQLNTKKNHYYQQFISLMLLTLLFFFSNINTVNLLLKRYYISEERPPARKFDIKPSHQLTKDYSIPLHIIQKHLDDPLPLKRISILFGTYERQNLGSAKLLLTAINGDNLTIPFELPGLYDNHYKTFELDNKPYISGKIIYSTGDGISVWESHEESGIYHSCLSYESSNGLKRHTKGCPHIND